MSLDDPMGLDWGCGYRRGWGGSRVLSEQGAVIWRSAEAVVRCSAKQSERIDGGSHDLCHHRLSGFSRVVHQVGRLARTREVGRGFVAVNAVC